MNACVSSESCGYQPELRKRSCTVGSQLEPDRALVGVELRKAEPAPEVERARVRAEDTDDGTSQSELRQGAVHEQPRRLPAGAVPPRRLLAEVEPQLGLAGPQEQAAVADVLAVDQDGVRLLRVGPVAALPVGRMLLRRRDAARVDRGPELRVLQPGERRVEMRAPHRLEADGGHQGPGW